MSKPAANRILRAGVLMLGLGTTVPAMSETSETLLPASALSAEMTIRLAFDWFSNAAPILPGTQAKALRRVIPGPGGWICSPAGFGQHSTCYQG